MYAKISIIKRKKTHKAKRQVKLAIATVVNKYCGVSRVTLVFPQNWTSAQPSGSRRVTQPFFVYQ